MQWQATVVFFNTFHVPEERGYNLYAANTTRIPLGNGWMALEERMLSDASLFDNWDDANHWVSNWGNRFKDLIDLKRRMEFQETWEEEVDGDV